MLLILISSCVWGRADEDTPDPVQPDTQDVQQPGISWGPLLWQSLFFTGVEHSFHLATQDYTRHALKGKFFDDWARSIGNVHGWADGDSFLTNYVGHPMQGSVSAFILVQNDPKYRKAEFGRNRKYWKSRLRATLFSFVFSEQLEIGPISEASIGNAQNYFPQQGLVDHIITPAMGAGLDDGRGHNRPLYHPAPRGSNTEQVDESDLPIRFDSQPINGQRHAFGSAVASRYATWNFSARATRRIQLRGIADCQSPRASPELRYIGQWVRPN